MANHKRGLPKKARAGCLFCKPQKMNGARKGEAAKTMQERRADAKGRDE